MKCSNFPHCLYTFSKRSKEEVCQAGLPNVGRKMKKDIDNNINKKKLKKDPILQFYKAPKAVQIGEYLYSVYNHGHKRTVVKSSQSVGGIHFCEHKVFILRRGFIIKSGIKGCSI